MRSETSMSRRVSGLLLIGTLTVSSVAVAAGPPLQVYDSSDSAAVAVEPASPIEGFGSAIDPAGLAAMRGGDDVTGEVDIDGVVDRNHAENITSGTNTLAGDAFANANGINTVIQNSGSNVLIQHGMVVNVQFGSPAP